MGAQACKCCEPTRKEPVAGPPRPTSQNYTASQPGGFPTDPTPNNATGYDESGPGAGPFNMYPGQQHQMAASLQPGYAMTPMHQEPMHKGGDPELDEFLQRLKTPEGVDLSIVRHTGEYLQCCLVYTDSPEPTFVIKNEAKQRKVKVSELAEVLKEADELQRIETSADIISGQRCIGLVLSTTNHCIPVEFKSTEHRDLFVRLYEKLKDSS